MFVEWWMGYFAGCAATVECVYVYSVHGAMCYVIFKIILISIISFSFFFFFLVQPSSSFGTCIFVRLCFFHQWMVTRSGQHIRWTWTLDIHTKWFFFHSFSFSLVKTYIQRKRRFHKWSQTTFVIINFSLKISATFFCHFLNRCWLVGVTMANVTFHRISVKSVREKTNHRKYDFK